MVDFEEEIVGVGDFSLFRLGLFRLREPGAGVRSEGDCVEVSDVMCRESRGLINSVLLPPNPCLQEAVLSSVSIPLRSWQLKVSNLPKASRRRHRGGNDVTKGSSISPL